MGVYFESLAERASERRRRTVERERRLVEALPGLVRLLVERYGARRVVLVGSLAEGVVREGSDLDLLVEGLDLERLLGAWNEANELAGVPVDLIRAESLSPEWREFHTRHGRVLHG